MRVTIKGEPVPIPFSFGGWASIKKIVDGKSAVLMSDTVLFEEEVDPLISSANPMALKLGQSITISFMSSQAFSTCTCMGWARRNS